MGPTWAGPGSFVLKFDFLSEPARYILTFLGPSIRHYATSILFSSKPSTFTRNVLQAYGIFRKKKIRTFVF